MKKIRLIELFAGVGSQAMAMRDIKADFEHYKVVEFDKYAIASYNAIHNTNFPTIDITKIKGDDLEIIDTDKYNYILTYSFPCQDLSLAGKQRGMEKGTGTRSGLLWEVERLLNESQHLPQVLLMENVIQVHSESNVKSFNSWLEFLSKKGYLSFYKDLNAKDYGVAQNRDRCFVVSILDGSTTKSNDDFLFPCMYEFPEPIKLTKVIRDYLEDEVEEKYYLKDYQIDDLFKSNYSQKKQLLQKKEICDTILARDYKDPKCIQIGNLKGGKLDKINESCRRLYSIEGISPTINTFGDGNTETKICYNDNKNDGGGYIPMVFENNDDVKPKCLGNIYGKDKSSSFAGNVYDKNSISPTLNTMQGGNRQPLILDEKNKIKTVGNYSPSNHDATRIVDIEGIAPTVKENHGSVTAIRLPEATKKGYTELNIGGIADFYYINSENRRGRVQGDGNICPSLMANNRDLFYYEGIEKKPVLVGGIGEKKSNGGTQYYYQDRVYSGDAIETSITAEFQPNYQIDYKIRKLTPKECWRLMGFSDDDFEKARAINSNTQLYKQAGNSIVKNVLMAIFNKLLPMLE